MSQIGGAFGIVRPWDRAMTVTTSPELQRAIDTIAVPGITVAHRLIAEGDETALLPEERAAFAGSVVKVRRASGAARIVARELLRRLGQDGGPIPRSSAGPPVWPHGIVGSLAHDSRVAVAAVAMQRDFSAVGIDVEPAEPLDADLLPIVATAQERALIQDDPLGGRLLFAVKEAVYKAVYPLDGVFLDHEDVDVNLRDGIAVVRNSRPLHFRYCIAMHMVALAFIPAR
jgi:4'-phosphopantetheinyl transferase EntD